MPRLSWPRFFRPAPGRRFSRFDLLVYRLFHWRWQQHFIDHPDLRQAFLAQLESFDARRRGPIGRLRVVSPPEQGPEPSP